VDISSRDSDSVEVESNLYLYYSHCSHVGVRARRLALTSSIGSLKTSQLLSGKQRLSTYALRGSSICKDVRKSFYSGKILYSGKTSHHFSFPRFSLVQRKALGS